MNSQILAQKSADNWNIQMIDRSTKLRWNFIGIITVPGASNTGFTELFLLPKYR
jgi:hypothetical protein